MLVVVYGVLLVVYEPLSGGILCQIYSPAFVGDDVTSILVAVTTDPLSCQ